MVCPSLLCDIDQQSPQIPTTSFRNPANRSLPQLEYRPGTSPNQAAAIGVHYGRQLPGSQIVILTVRSWPN